MNLAQAVEYDTEAHCYRIFTEPVPPGSWIVKFPNVARRPLDEEPRGKRAFRPGGTEVINVLRAAGRLLLFRDIKAKLPHVDEHTLDCRLSYMASKGYIDRVGEKYKFFYGLPGCSTSEST